MSAAALRATGGSPSNNRTPLGPPVSGPLTSCWKRCVACSEFQPGAESGKHFHPGEEFGYLLEGTLELTLDGKPPVVVKAGDPIFIPAGTVHNAKNVGKTTAKVLATYVLEKGKPLATPVK